MDPLIPEIERPSPPEGKKDAIKEIADLLQWDVELHTSLPAERPRIREIWYRGVSSAKHQLLPGIYRDPVEKWLASAPDEEWLGSTFPKRLKANLAAKREDKRLQYERQMMLAFEREKGPLFAHDSEQTLYFSARHFGMPNRLLDWTTNPLVALFMAAFDENGSTPRTARGVIYAMQPMEHLDADEIYQQHDPIVSEAIETVTTWRKPTQYSHRRFRARILPVRPHVLGGRIERQNSRFTLHSHGAGPVRFKNRAETLQCRAVGNNQKIKEQLSRLNVNQFTVYNTMDRLVQEIRENFGYDQN